ncbi:MAG: hypothetical protein V3T59_01145 [Desulfobacterales bacterium]
MLAHAAIKLDITGWNIHNFYKLLPDFEFDEKEYEINLELATPSNEVSPYVFEHIFFSLKQKYKIEDKNLFKINIQKKFCSEGNAYIMFWIDKIHDGLSHY